MTTQELYDFVLSLKESKVKFGDHPIYNMIDLRTLTHDILGYSNMKNWIDSKNMPDHLKKNIILAILSTNPPENVKNELIAIVL